MMANPLRKLLRPLTLLTGLLTSLWLLGVAQLPVYAPALPFVSLTPTLPAEAARPSKLSTFKTCFELSTALQNVKSEQALLFEKGWGTGLRALQAPSAAITDGVGGADAETALYSRTNVQVVGVDEADIVKTDGTFLYYVLENPKKLVIAKAYLPRQSQVVSEIDLKEQLQGTQVFIEGNYLLVVGQNFGSGRVRILNEPDQSQTYPLPQTQISSQTTLFLYDVSDRAQPKLVRTLKFEGDYVSSRKIGDKVYLVTNTHKYHLEPQPLKGGRQRENTEKESVVNKYGLLPLYADIKAVNKGLTLVNREVGYQPLVACDKVGKLTPVQSSNFLSVIGFSMTNPNSEISKKVLLGASDKVYASAQNLYVASTVYPFVPDPSLTPPASLTEKTKIFKFALVRGKVLYQGEGEVKGWVLNQFSLDEWQGNLRIATTSGHVSQRKEPASSSNLYVLDRSLNQIGQIENIAPGEQIYSARFMGDKAFLVTFQKVDPFFTLDLADPASPKIIGRLKIPGYSDYLHLLDKNHVLGVGKEALSAEQGNFAWYQGLKMAIFDVTDLANPREVDKVVIGDRGTDSYVLHDHKAFLYNPKNGLLVIPVLLAEIKNKNVKQRLRLQTYGDYTYQGAYIYRVAKDFKFELIGRITHYPPDADAFLKSGYFYYGDEYAVKRSLYIGNFLYTLSERFIQANHLFDLTESAKISL